MKKKLFFISILTILCLIANAQTAYITNSGSNTVSVINVATNTISATIPVGTYPFGVSVSPDGSKVYVANYSANTVSVINCASNTVSATIAVGANPYGVSVSPDGSKVYVANYGANTISVINAAANTVSATISLGLKPYGISVSPDGSKVYITNYDDASVSVLNTASNTVTATIAVGSYPYGVSVSPDGSKVFVANSDACVGNTVCVINTTTNTVSDTITVGSGPLGLSVSPDGSKLYVANGGCSYPTNLHGTTVSVINTATNTVTATITVGYGPYGISVTPDGSKVYVANIYSNNVSVINTTTNTVSATITVGTSPAAFGNFISIYPNPLVSISAHTNVSCYGGNDGRATVNASGGTPPYTYLWNTMPVQTSATATGLIAGTYTVTVTDANSNTSTVNIIITQPSLIIISNPQTICNGSNYFFNGHTYSIAGNYYDTLTAFNSCDSIIETQLTVNPLPLAHAGDDTTVCDGINDYTLTASGGGSYLWSYNNLTTQNISISTDTTSTYFVTVTDSLGCSANDSVLIIINPLPTALITADSTNTFLQCNQNFVSYQWSFNGNIISGATLQTYTPSQNGGYSIEVTDSNGCIALSTAFDVIWVGIAEIQNMLSIIVIPNPSGDNIRIGIPQKSEIEILNLQGQTIKQIIAADNQTTIDISALARGMYFIKVTTEKEVITKKFIKE